MNGRKMNEKKNHRPKKQINQIAMKLKAHNISNPVKSIILAYTNLASNKLHKRFKYN